MKQNQIQTQKQTDLVSQLIISGDLSKLTQDQKVQYYNGYCERLGLDPFTKPFDLLRLNGREILYCTRSGSQQLNKLHQVSHAITSREVIEAASVYQVTAKASLPDGRYTESIGAVNIGGLKGDAYANAIMKAETKAKRRATLDLLGLGVLDETEAETIQNAQVVDVKPTGKVSEKVQEIIEAFPEMEVKITPIEEEKLERKSIGQIMILINKAQSIKELTSIYYENQYMCDTNSLLKDTLKSKKNELKPIA